MLKFFTEKDTGTSVAVNVNSVLCVREFQSGTKIIFNDSSCLVVDGIYLENVARLNERD